MRSAAIAGIKRKRVPEKAERRQSKTRARKESPGSEDDDAQETIARLESQILESRKHYNNIATLLQLAKSTQTRIDVSTLAAVALCRVFSRLLTTGDMNKGKGMAESEMVIAQWLKARYRECLDFLLDQYLRSEEPQLQSVGLALLMRLVKEESKEQRAYDWKHGTFSDIVETILSLPEDNVAHDEFAEKYFGSFDDIRFYTFQSIVKCVGNNTEQQSQRTISSNSLTLLMTLDEVPASKSELQRFYTEIAEKNRRAIQSLSVYKENAQEAWLAALRAGLTQDQRKAILAVFSHQIAPWFQQPEMLMDFLTDSYNVGGGTSLLALSGLYYLMSERNLDYPSFYDKLYTLLDENLLHSKHRSRFFRLLDTFMASTHLPAALVASFIKRLSRLALYAPPAGIVIVIPWIYNMFKRHPVCTFMMHREIRDSAKKRELEEVGMSDPFDMEEDDPMLTDAIESSVWELETLQNHYHPNVATLAKIISEQFTKRSYNLEDFLDHSYNALLDVELNRDLKKEPIGEFEIPKHIFTAEGTGLGQLGQLMGSVLEAR